MKTYVVQSWEEASKRWINLRSFKSERGAARMVARHAMLGLVNRYVAR